MKYLIGVLFTLMLSACGDSGKASESANINPNVDDKAPNAEVPAVTDLVIFSTGVDKVVLRWADDNRAAGYLIRRNGEQIAIVEKGLFTYTDTGLVANNRYRYEVIAFNENGSESSTQTITAQSIMNTAPVVDPLETKILLDTLAPGDVAAQVNASDADGHQLAYTVNSALFEIDREGTVRVASSLLSLSGKTVLLTIEVSDGYSVTTRQIKVGIFPLTANGENQGLSRQVFKDKSITYNINTLKSLKNYPDAPTETTIEPEFVAPSDVDNNYGQVMQGYIIPPVSGDYYFWMASDDQSELYLSDSEKSEDAVKIAHLTSRSYSQEWDRYRSQKSSVQTLVAGKPYYIKAIMTEDGGSDHLSVAWQGPGIERAVIGNEFLRLPLDLKNPLPVQNLNWIKLEDDKILLEWNAASDNRGISHYDIYEDGQKIATTVNTAFELTGLKSAKLYKLMVKAFDISGNESALSKLLLIQMDDFTSPSIVSDISLISTGPNHIKFSWVASLDENNTPVLYRVYQNDQLIHQGYETELQVNALVAGTAYDFEIEALDSAGNSSARSTILNASTIEYAPGTPIFDYPSFDYAVAGNAAANSVFATLLFQAEATPVVTIESGNADGYFSINNLGELSLARMPEVDESRIFELVVKIELAGKSSIAAVNVNVVDSKRLNKTGIFQQVWNDIDGNKIDLINTKKSSSIQNILTEVKSLVNMGDDYGQRLAGYLRVPTSGEYTFWVASDDDSEVRISADMSMNKAQAIAKVTGYTRIDAWHDRKVLKRDISLVAGQYYYFEVLHKEGGGRDHLSVAWQGPGIVKQPLSASYFIPLSSLLPTEVEVQTAYQSSFETLGNEITIEYLVAASAAGFPVIVYYGNADAGESSQGWQYQMTLGELLAGNNSFSLPNIVPGDRYYIRFESTGPAGIRWSPATQVDTVVIDEGKTVGEGLPQTLSLTVNIDNEDVFLELAKHSVRSPNFQLLTFDARRFQQFQAISPMPEIRTYRGYVSNNPYQVVTGVVDEAGTIYLSGWGGDSQQWSSTLDISDQINTDALGNSEHSTREMMIDFYIPASIDNRLYLPQPGRDFHNNLARVSFLHENSQFKDEAGGNIINAIAQMEGHINELDYVWAQKTGLRWDIGRSLIEVNGVISEATQERPVATDSTNFRMDFQDPHGVGYCWGGGDWLGCVANYTMNWGFIHEVGHNFDLGHGEQTDNNNHIQQPSTQMGNMQAWKTTKRLQEGSKFKPAEALSNPMLPATFKDYLTVYQDQSASIDPLANDYDANGDVLTIESFDATTLENGRVRQNRDGSLHYTPAVGFVGVDQFAYVATDGRYKTRGPVQIQVLTNGLTGHWDMDTLNEDVVTDLSGQGNDLSAPDLARLTPASHLADVQVLGPNNQSNQALSIPLIASDEEADDGIGHSLLPHKLDPGHNSFTAALWFKYSAIEGKKLLMGKSSAVPNNMQYGGWEIRTDGSSLEMQASYRDRLMKNNVAQIAQENALVDGSWHHAVMVIDRENNQLRGYLDGIALPTQADLPIGSGPIMAAMNSTSYGGGSPFRIGGHAGLACVNAAVEGDPQVCSMRDGQAFDNVKLYHKALTAQEVTALFAE